jgi:SWI/SNF-related matrix-associated actin-dependent regulator of chromatin subfamily A3
MSAAYAASSTHNMYSNPIDLTSDDPDDGGAPCRPSAPKRARSAQLSDGPALASALGRGPFGSAAPLCNLPPPSSFAFQRPLPPAAFAPPPPAPVAPPPASTYRHSDRQVIDLTGSPSPPATPPAHSASLAPGGLPSNLPPKTPVCIGLLCVTALVLYPISYLRSSDQPGSEADWGLIRLQHEHVPGKSETIHIKAPNWKAANGEMVAGETFGVVEQKVASSLGPMMGKGLIKLDGKVRRGMPNVCASSGSRKARVDRSA